MTKELGQRKIAVNVIALGAIETHFGDAVRGDINSFFASQTALVHVGITDDIGGAIVALFEENRWVNAQRIEVSGGQSI